MIDFFQIYVGYLQILVGNNWKSDLVVYFFGIWTVKEETERGNWFFIMFHPSIILNIGNGFLLLYQLAVDTFFRYGITFVYFSVIA